MSSNKQSVPPKVPFFIGVCFVGDSEMHDLNKKYRKKDYPTDVLSFDINETMPDGTYHLGDVVVNAAQAARQSKDYSNTASQEMSELVAHGVLHLLGIHHDGDDH